MELAGLMILQNCCNTGGAGVIMRNYILPAYIEHLFPLRAVVTSVYILIKSL